LQVKLNGIVEPVETYCRFSLVTVGNQTAVMICGYI